MADRLPSIVRGFAHFLHGGDYNPEQWIRTPEVWDEDVRLMRLAGVNVASVGIFAWSALEPSEGQFEFGWLDRIFEKLWSAGVRIVLATPGGAKPAWLAQKYPEVLRVDAYGRRQLWGGRHNHCFTSPIYRRQCQTINSRLAERYGKHPALALWHVNNEYGGACHCDLCVDSFRDFLRRRYDNNLDALNFAWWNAFWSHTITDWSQINPPSPIGEMQVHGLNLDWRRFITHQTIDCFGAESEPLRRITPEVPVTTNLMSGGFTEVDYYKLADACDVVSWDSYPSYHDREDSWLGPAGAVWTSFIHSQRRAMKDKPFVLMESAPAQQNYKPVCKLKRPGAHRAEALQAIGHGSDSVMYFQWRKSRGSVEKFHGAVVDHFAGENTRVFQEVAEVGKILAQLDDIVAATSKPEVAFIYDYENRWAINDAAGPINGKKDKDYDAVMHEHYRPFWSAGVGVDVVGEDHEFDRYKLLIAPMLYLIRPGVAERIERFVAAGGMFVTTFFSGVVNESDLCFLNGFPGPLRKLMGAWAEEIDALYDDERVAIAATDAGKRAGLAGSYQGGFLCDLLHAESAEVLATYGSEFYAGRPAVTVNSVGRGRAYYIASRNDARFNADFYNHLIAQLGLRRALGTNLPDGVTATVRTDGTKEFIFLLSFNPKPANVNLGGGAYHDRLTGGRLSGRVELTAYGTMILERSA